VSKYDVLVFGDYCLDLVFTGLPGMPELGREIVASGFAMLPGGTYNTAVHLHRLGVKVGWAGDFGKDEFSTLVLEHTRSEGLDTSLFTYHDKPLRRITVSASFPDERAFIAYYDPDPVIPAALKALARYSARAVFIPGLYCGSAFEAGLKLIRLKRMSLIMDGNSSEEKLDAEDVRKSIAACDLFLPNRREALRLTSAPTLEQALEDLGRICPYVVIKDSARGAWSISNGETFYAPALPVKAVDTTGAGDAFNAGFIKAWLDGKAPIDCLRSGNITGGLSTLGLGGTGRFIMPEELQQRLAEYKE
jgi:sugar/nucleoside kinase (ribokinase family)